MTGKPGKENILLNFFNDFLRIGQKLSNLEKCHQRFQLSDIGQLTSSCIISDLGGKEQPIKIQYFNTGDNNLIYEL